MRAVGQVGPTILTRRNVMPAEAGTHDTFQVWCALDDVERFDTWMAARAAMTKGECRHPPNVIPAEAGIHDTLEGRCALDESNALTLAWMAACAAMTNRAMRATSRAPQSWGTLR